MRPWVWMCYLCNHHQGRFSLSAWQTLLEAKKDRRAPKVLDLIRRLIELGVHPHDLGLPRIDAVAPDTPLRLEVEG